MALGKAPKNLTPNQQAKVEWIAKTDPRLYRAYKLKEALRLVFYNDTVKEAKEALDAWFKWARHCRIPAFVELQKKINRHMQSILNTIEYISQRLECCFASSQALDRYSANAFRVHSLHLTHLMQSALPSCSCVSQWQSASSFFQALSHPSGAT